MGHFTYAISEALYEGARKLRQHCRIKLQIQWSSLRPADNKSQPSERTVTRTSSDLGEQVLRHTCEGPFQLPEDGIENYVTGPAQLICREVNESPAICLALSADLSNILRGLVVNQREIRMKSSEGRRHQQYLMILDHHNKRLETWFAGFVERLNTGLTTAEEFERLASRYSIKSQLMESAIEASTKKIYELKGEIERIEQIDLEIRAMATDILENVFVESKLLEPPATVEERTVAEQTPPDQETEETEDVWNDILARTGLIYREAYKRYLDADRALLEHREHHSQQRESYLKSRIRQNVSREECEREWTRRYLEEGSFLTAEVIRAEEALKAAQARAWDIEAPYNHVNSNAFGVPGGCDENTGYDNDEADRARIKYSDQKLIDDWLAKEVEPETKRRFGTIKRKLHLRVNFDEKSIPNPDQPWDSLSVRHNYSDKRRRYIDIWTQKMERTRAELPARSSARKVVPRMWTSCAGRIRLKWDQSVGRRWTLR